MKARRIAPGLSAVLSLPVLAIFGAVFPPPGVASAAPQADVPTLRVNVGLVQVEVVVLDDKGKPLAGLKKDDFHVFQDDKEQQISAFDAVSEDATDSTLPPSLSDVDERFPRGKVVLFLFDQSTISSTNSKLVIDAAENYVRRHRHANDLMGVAIFVQSIRITCPLTHDPAKVIEAIRRANEAFAGSSGRVVQGTVGAKELRSQVVDVFRSLKSLCTSLEPVRGRKTILLFTEDMSVPTDVLSEYNSLVAEARKSDVTFFTLDARGRAGTSTNSASLLDTEIGARPTAPRSTEVNLAQFQNQTSPTILRSLASQTNGYPVFNTDNLDGALDRVDQELGHYYVLGFLSENARADGKPHKIEVRLNVKDAKLKYRDTYTDPHPTDPLAGSRNESPLYAALAQSSPATQVPVSFRPVYFFETPEVAQVPVFVKIGHGSIALKKSSGQWTGSASIMGVALAEDGTAASRFSGEINVAVSSAQAEAFKNQDLVYRNSLRLRPGKYHLKLVVMDEKGKKGTAEQDLSIPAFNRGGLTAGSLIVSQEMVPLPGLIKELKPQMLSQMDPMQYKGFQIYAPVQAGIDSQQPMVVFYRIYTASDAGAGRSFKARVEAINEKGEGHLFPLIDLASSALPVGPRETAIGFMLPCKDLKPGRYRLRVETVDTGSGQSVVSEADFQLRGSDREPAGKGKPQSDSEQSKPLPATVPRAAESPWSPSDIDHTVYPLAAGRTCPLSEVLTGAGSRIEELIRNVDRFTATEIVEHQDVGHRGNLLNPEIRKFDYMVSIHEVRGGLMNVEEYRNRDFSPDQMPNRLATLGTPGVVLIFHPRYIPDFDTACEGLGDWNGQHAWLVRFEQRKDRPNNIRSYRIDGIRYDVRLRGRAWIKADTYEIVRMETDLADSIPRIQLHVEHLKIEYQPVDFPERKMQLWLPKSAELYLDYRGHRFRREHHFTDFKLFSVETKQEIARP